MSDVDLPENWREIPLGSLGIFFRGQGGTRSDESDNGLPCIRYGDLYTHHDCIVKSFCSAIKPDRASSYTPLQFGDVVFAGSGETFEEIGKAAAYCGQEKAYAGGDTIIFRPSSSLDSYFAGYAVNSHHAAKHKSRLGQGSSVIHISAEHLARISLRLPPIRQQQTIATILQTIDRAIAHTEALIEKYHQIKAGLMHDLFTRGIGADGKLRPTREEAPELYQESAIGWIPQTWVLSTLDQEVRIIDCKHVTPIYCDDGYPIIRPRNIRSDGLDFENVDYISPCDFKKLTDIHAPKKGDIIYSRNASFGIPCYVETEREFAIGQDVVVMTQITTDTKYIYYLLKSDLIWSQISRLFAGSTFSRINLGDIREFLIPVPREHEQIEIAVRLSSIDEKIDREIEKKNKSYKLKAGLMHDLLTGKVPVKVNPSEVSHV